MLLWLFLLRVWGYWGWFHFLTEQRKKEVGIRKVLGASAGLVVGLFLKEFIRLVIVSCLLAWPIAYWATNEWLQNFAYRIEISALPFLIGGAFMVGLTTITVAYKDDQNSPGKSNRGLAA